MGHFNVLLLRISLLILSILGIVFSFELANRLTLGLLAQEFRDWHSIGSPPGGASSIVGADLNELWVQSNSGQTYAYKLDCIHTDKCRAWFPLSALPEFEVATQPGGVRLTDCAVGGSPRVRVGPPDFAIECIQGTYLNSEKPADVYYAITADGTAYYVYTGGQLFYELTLTILLGLISSTVWIAAITITYSRLRNKLVGVNAGA